MKALGYGLAILGIAILIFSKTISSLSFLKGISKIMAYIIIVGLILVIAGIFFVMDTSSSSSKQAEEVPVYDKKGKTIVGYRRTK
jgi:hypothetical protein